MRQRKIKNLEEKLEGHRGYIVADPKDYKGTWKANVFENAKPIYLEIGCGKGKFITDHAKSGGDANYIAIEGHESVVLRALEKAEQGELDNLKFILEYISNIEEYFAENELDGIFLNFSDPWPKDRHAKRRLTYGDRLIQYCKVIKPGGFIKFKTDNDGLYDFSMEQIKEKNLIVEEETRDLHNSPYVKENITTEYEDKFSSAGKNINYVKIRA